MLPGGPSHAPGDQAPAGRQIYQPDPTLLHRHTGQRRAMEAVGAHGGDQQTGAERSVSWVGQVVVPVSVALLSSASYKAIDPNYEYFLAYFLSIGSLNN